jgi:hypothetical protein
MADGAGVGDALDDEVHGILDGRPESWSARDRLASWSRGRWISMEQLLTNLVVCSCGFGLFAFGFAFSKSFGETFFALGRGNDVTMGVIYGSLLLQAKKGKK